MIQWTCLLHDKRKRGSTYDNTKRVFKLYAISIRNLTTPHTCTTTTPTSLLEGLLILLRVAAILFTPPVPHSTLSYGTGLTGVPLHVQRAGGHSWSWAQSYFAVTTLHTWSEENWRELCDSICSSRCTCRG